jgi:hypothetical protein
MENYTSECSVGQYGRRWRILAKQDETVRSGYMAEDSANRTHQRLEEPPNGFEDRPRHQPRLSSGPIVANCLESARPEG